MNASARHDRKTMERLGRSFPSFQSRFGSQPWNADAVDAWASTGGPSHGERVTAQFLLAVYNPHHPWASGRFDLMEALRVWDKSHHDAFLVWASDPWWL